MTDDNMPEPVAHLGWGFPIYSADQMRAYRAQALEEAAKVLDDEHTKSKHMHNYAAFYARAIRALKGTQ